MEQLGLDLNLVKIFIKVVEFKSFSETSRHLKIPKSTISRSVSTLEKELGVQLILRTTRQFSLTHQGERFYQDSKKIISDFDTTVSHMLKVKEGTHGKIRLTAPLDLGVSVLNPLIIEYSQQNPLVEFDLEYTDEVVNVVREGFDLALRIGPQKDSRLKTKKIGETSFCLVASPYFLQQQGQLLNFEQLQKCPYLHFGRLPSQGTLKFSTSKESFIIKNKPQITINHLQSLKDMTLASKGFSMLPDFFVKNDLQRGTLVQLLKSYKTHSVGISWVMPEHKENSVVIRNFRDFVTPRLLSSLER